MTNKEWFAGAKFGMMIHWGLYSLPAGECSGLAKSIQKPIALQSPSAKKLFVDAAIHCSGSGKTKGAHIGHAGSTIQTVLSAQIVRFQKRCSKKPSAVCTTSLNTTETPSSHKCSPTSKKSATAGCFGAKTSSLSTRKYPTYSVRFNS